MEKEASSFRMSILKPNIFTHLRWEHLLAGVSGGVVSTLTLHPFDLIKIRLQVNEGKISSFSSSRLPKYSGMVDVCRSVISQSGFAGLYQGAVPNIVGAGASWGLYFFAYNSLKYHKLNKTEKESLDPLVHMWLATQAGVFTLLITNPIWVAKTRLCLQYKENGISPVRGMSHCLSLLYQQEGIKGLYRGLVPGLFGVSHGALQFMGYEELKKFHNKLINQPHYHPLGTFEYLLYAAISKIFAVTFTYPYQVVRSRLQEQHRKYDGSLHVIKHLFKNEGIRGFYKGLLPGILRVTPACCLTFIIYEKIIHYIEKPHKKYHYEYNKNKNFVSPSPPLLTSSSSSSSSSSSLTPSSFSSPHLPSSSSSSSSNLS